MNRLAAVSIAALVSGCATNNTEDCETLTVDPSIHPNSAIFSWATEEASTLSISYQVNGGRLISRMLSDTPVVAHDGAIHGLPSLAEISYTAVAATENGDVTTCQGSFTTNNLPPDLPEFAVTIYEPDQLSSERFLVGVAMGQDMTHPFVINRAGQIVWFDEGADYNSIDQVEVALDGRGMLIGSYAFRRDEDLGTLHRTSLLGEISEEIPMVGGHHFFKQRSTDTVTHPSVDIREWIRDGEAFNVVGDALVEMEADGSDAVEIFSSWDELEPYEHRNFWSNFYPQGADWTHLNSIDYRPSEDRYILSLPFLRSVLVVDAKTGAIIEDYSDVNYTFTDSPLTDAHDVRMIDDNTLSVFNLYMNSAMAVEYTIDRAAKTITPIWSYQPGTRTTYMGQFYRLKNGNRIVNFGSAGIIQEVTPDGKVVWEVQTPLGFWFGNGQMITSIYEAAQPY